MFIDTYLGVDDKGTTLLDVASVSHLATAGAVAAGSLDALNIGPGVGLAEDCDGILGLLDGFDRVVQDKWELWDLLDAVTLGHGQSWESGGGNGGDGSVTALGYVNLEK